MTSDEALPLLKRIAAGHAFNKHIVEGKEFPNISGRKEFQELIFKILTYPDEERKLERNRRAYWSSKHATIPIRGFQQ